MAPQAMQYKANSVIYFQGDSSEKIYILKAGRVSLNSNDIETGQEVHDAIQMGEFFGVKSALGRYPREESAMVLSDASVIVFSVPEFEALASQNTRIIIKMLKVFSNQLRRMHKRVQNLLAMDEHADPEEGLFQIAKYYLSKRRYSQALYAFRRYQTYYPSGNHDTEVTQAIVKTEGLVQKYGQGRGPVPSVDSTPAGASSGGATASKGTAGMSDAAKQYYEAVSTFGQQKFKEALAEFKEILTSNPDEEYTIKALFEIGRCFFELREFDKCIKHFTGLVQKYPKMPDLPEVLYYIGQGHEEKGDSIKAKGFYNKVLSMVDDGSPVKRKTNKALRALEG